MRSGGVDPDKLRKRIERAIDKLIAALDYIDAPAEDLEGDDRENDLADSGSDLEEDPASGIADQDGLLEQCGEMYSCGFTSATAVE